MRRIPLLHELKTTFPEVGLIEFHGAPFHGLVHLCEGLTESFCYVTRKKKAFAKFYKLLRNHINCIEAGGIAGSASSLFATSAE